jgi:DNA-binding IclR family transcriptional regulator
MADRMSLSSRSPASRRSPRSQKAEPSRAKRPEVVTRRVPAVSRAIAILRLLGKSETPLGVHAVANALDLVPSTCLHILRVLVAEELASFDPDTKRYGLTAGVLSIASGALRRRSFGDLAQSRLDDLSRHWGATAIGVEAVGLKHMVVVAISRTDQALRLRVDVGSRFPALISATGRCIAAFGGHATDDVERRFRLLRWDNPPTLEHWRAEVEATRVAGYAVDEGRYISGVTIIAAPVLTHGVARNVLIVLGVGEQLRRAGHAEIGEALRREAAELSERLKGVG